MGIAERREKEKLEIRKLILEASMKLFIEEGFENVSIRRIADLIEYSPTTVYLYFKDKDEIIFNLHDIGFDKLVALNQNLIGIDNPLMRLHKMGENYLNFAMKNPEYYDLMFILRAPMKKLKEMDCSWENGDAAMGQLRATISECMEKGYIARSDVNLVSISVWSMVHGLVSLAVRDRMDKFLPENAAILPVLKQSLEWLINMLSRGSTHPAG